MPTMKEIINNLPLPTTIEPAEQQRKSRIFRLLRGTVTGSVEPTEAFATLRRMEHADAILSAGSLALDEALRTSSIEASSDWLDKASKSFERVIEKTNSGGEVITDSAGGAAAMRMAQLPNYASILATSELPGTAIAQRVLDNTVDVAMKMKRGIDQHIINKQRGIAKLSLFGVLAEADVLCLGQRYAIREHADRSWFPLLAKHEDDHHGWSHNYKHDAWDISVYTHLGSAPELSYRVQVKSSTLALQRDRQKYEDAGVDVICVNPDLKLRKERNTVLRIAEDFNQERLGDPFAASRLDIRTDKMLDILG